MEPKNPLMFRRGSISKVREEARNSLKNLSRPFTPRDSRTLALMIHWVSQMLNTTLERPLFQGHDYRPHSRPTSSSMEEEYSAKFEPSEFMTDYPSKRERQEDFDTPETKEETLSIPAFEILLQQDMHDREWEEQYVALTAEIHSHTQDGWTHGSIMIFHLMTALYELVIHAAPAPVRQLRLLELIFISSNQLGAIRSSKRRKGEEASSLDRKQLDQLGHVRRASAKLLFHLSKDSSLDQVFVKPSFLESILGLCEYHDAKSTKDDLTLFYAMAGLKNVSSVNEDIQNTLGQYGAIARLTHAMVRVMTMTSAQGLEQEKSTAQLLIQLTANLRHLSLNKAHHKQFYAANVISTLMSVMGMYEHHLELMYNISRILSKLTLHEYARRAFAANVDHFAHAVNCIQSCNELLPVTNSNSRSSVNLIFIRLFFTLGNLTSSNLVNRQELLGTSFGSYPFVYALENFVGQLVEDDPEERRRPEEQTTTTTTEHHRSEIVEVLVKLLRLLANCSIDRDLWSQNETVARSVVELLRYSDVTDELLFNSLSFVTNVAYHLSGSQQPMSNAAWTSTAPALIQAITPTLLHSNAEIVTESTRALGNISRWDLSLNPEIWTSQDQVLEILVVLLDHVEESVVFGALGVLMNIALGSFSKAKLLTLGMTATLVSLLRSSGVQDFELATMVCKTLVNYFSNTGVGHHGIMKEGQEKGACLKLSQTLDELLDVAQECTPTPEGNEFITVGLDLSHLLTKLNNPTDESYTSKEAVYVPLEEKL